MILNFKVMIEIIILAYVINIFLNRWLNKILVIQKKGEPIPLIWFFSLATTIVLLFIFFKKSKFNNWFTGKNWDNE